MSNSKRLKIMRQESDPHSLAAPQLESIPWWVKNILRRNKRAFGGRAKIY